MKFTSFAIITFLACPALFAGENVEFAGEHKATFSIPAVKSHQDFSGNLKSPKLESDLSLTTERSGISLHAGLRITNQLYQSSEEQSVSFRPLENSLSLSTGNVQTTLGYQYFSWGSADKLNPVDNLNPKDYTTGPDAEKLPLFAASVKYYPTDRLSMELIYAPYDQEDIFPTDVADHIPPALFGRSHMKSVSLFQSGLNIETVSEAGEKEVVFDKPDFDPSSFLAGTRIKLMSGSFDMAATYIYDIDQFYSPSVTLERYSLIDESTQIAAPLTFGQIAATAPTQGYGLKSISLSRKRIHRIGLDAKTVVDRFGLWGEACLSLTEWDKNHPYESRGHQLDWTCGVDFPYGSSDQHYLNIQQIGRYVFDFDSDFSKRYPNGKPSSADLFNEKAMQDYYYRLLTNRLAYTTEGLLIGAAVRSEWSLFDGTIKPALEGVYVYPFHYDQVMGKRYGDLMGTAKIEWKAADAASINFGTQGFYSILKDKGCDEIRNIEENKIGLYFPHSRIFLEGVFSWNR